MQARRMSRSLPAMTILAPFAGTIRSSGMMRNTTEAWGAPAKLLHWTVATLVLVQIALGWAAVAWHLSPTKLDLFVLHKSTGMLILLLMLVRLFWRWINVTPFLPAGMQAWERAAAQASHFILYLLLLLAPVTGWIINSATNIPFRMFWLIPIPAVADPDKALAETASRIHFGLFVLLVLVLVVHVAAALRHHYVVRDNVLARMLPGTGRAP
jgi:cytochrome b561